MAEQPKLEIGQRVKVLVDTPEHKPAEGVIRVLQDYPGKLVGVELDNFVANGHTLDGETKDQEKVDQETGTRYGKGWWTRPENIEILA